MSESTTKYFTGHDNYPDDPWPDHQRFTITETRDGKYVVHDESDWYGDVTFDDEDLAEACRRGLELYESGS